jgi:hypothetical protein
MLNEPRIYRHPVIQLVILFVVFGILIVGFLSSQNGAETISSIPFLLVVGFIFFASLFSLTAKTTISEDEISSTNLFGTKVLRWSEIESVSGNGYRIKLHNRDGDVTVSPSPQLNGYEEVIEWIGAKRTDLFIPHDYSEMSRGWTRYLQLAVVAILLLGMGIFLLTLSDIGIIPFIFFLLTALLMGYVTLAAPKSLVLEGDTLFIKYYFNEKTVRAHEIDSFVLSHTRTRNGKNYFIRIELVSKKYIRLSNVGPSLPVAFLVLKNWHKQFVRQ